MARSGVYSTTVPWCDSSTPSQEYFLYRELSGTVSGCSMCIAVRLSPAECSIPPFSLFQILFQPQLAFFL